MKYNGKYSLKENLFKGRGLGLLKELRSQNTQSPDPTRQISVRNTPMTKATFTALQNPGDVHQTKYLPVSHNDTGWRTQKKVAAWLLGEGFEIEWISSGSGQADLLAKKGGKTYSFEVGNPDKVTQLGNTYATGALARTSDTSEKTIEKQRAIGAQRVRNKNPDITFSNDELMATGGDIADTSFESSTDITTQETGAYWVADGADFLIMIEEGVTRDVPDNGCKIYGMALSKEGNALSQSEGWGLRTMANVIDKIISRNLKDEKGRFSQKQAGKSGGSWDSGRERRAGFRAFPKDIKDNMIKLN